MGWADHGVAELQKGNSATLIPHGNSMLPRIKSGQRVVVHPLEDGQPVKGDVVLVRIRGNVMMHLVSAIDGERYQISNNHGHVNGWVRRAAIYGRAEA